MRSASTRMLELGGMDDDDSLRLSFVVQAIRAVSELMVANNGEMPSGENIGALLRILADDAERVDERAQLEHRNQWLAEQRRRGLHSVPTD